MCVCSVVDVIGGKLDSPPFPRGPQLQWRNICAARAGKTMMLVRTTNQKLTICHSKDQRQGMS